MKVESKWLNEATDRCDFCGGYVRLWKIRFLFGVLRICPDCNPKLRRFLKRTKNIVEEAIKHHQKHGDMDGHVCLLNKCALHYSKHRVSEL